MARLTWRLDPALWMAIALQVGFGGAFIASTRFDVSGRTYFTLFDDAMVSMTYARNLAQGAGLIWNAGGSHVEGYTNFLWTLWMAALHIVGLPEPTVALAVMASGLAVLVANLIVIWRLARVVSESLTTARIAVLVTSLCYPLIFWTLRGMEVGLMALVVNLAVLQAVSTAAGERVRAGPFLWLALLPLIRPDGILPAVVVALFLGWRWVRAGRMSAAVALVACPLLVLTAHTFFRWIYYGDLLPNTYYLKVAGVPIADRLARGAATFWETVQSNLWVVALLMLLVRLDERLRPVVAVVVAQVLYSMWVGGDAWEQSGYANRYITAVLPLAVLVAARGVEQLFTPVRRSIVRPLVACIVGEVLLWTAVAEAPLRPPTSAAFVLVVVRALIGIWFLVAAVTVALQRPPWPRWPARAMLVPVTTALLLTLSVPFIGEWLAGEAMNVHDDARMARLGLGLRASTSPEASIAVVWAGAIPYFAHRRAIDLLGKSDMHIARLPPHKPFVPGHNKWDYRYSVGEERPDVIAQIWYVSSADLQLIRSLGYEWVGTAAFARVGAPTVDATRLKDVFAAFDRDQPAPGTVRSQR